MFYYFNIYFCTYNFQEWNFYWSEILASRLQIYVLAPTSNFITPILKFWLQNVLFFLYPPFVCVIPTKHDILPFFPDLQFNLLLLQLNKIIKHFLLIPISDPSKTADRLSPIHRRKPLCSLLFTKPLFQFFETDLHRCEFIYLGFASPLCLVVLAFFCFVGSEFFWYFGVCSELVVVLFTVGEQKKVIACYGGLLCSGRTCALIFRSLLLTVFLVWFYSESHRIWFGLQWR